MKLLTVTVVREFEKDVKKILHHSGVKAFTYMPVTGFKDLSNEDIEHNWFASEKHETESLLFWAFVEEENVSKAEAAVIHFNSRQQSLSRIHLTVLQVEKSI